MPGRWRRPGLIAVLTGACVLALSAGCRVPRHVHDPLEYPETKVTSSALELDVVDARPRGAVPSVRELSLPQDFAAAARARLASISAGQGPLITVRVGVGAADEVELVDARGEVTRVLVRLQFEVRVKDGPVLRRAESQASADIPRDEASPEEIDFVLGATALNAFDRYWANPATLTGLNRDLSAYAQKHPIDP